MSEGSLCPRTEPAEMMAMAAQPQARGSGRAFPWAEVKNMAQEPSVGLFPQRRAGQSPAEQTPLDFWVQPPHPQTPRAGFTSGHPQASGGQSSSGQTRGLRLLHHRNQVSGARIKKRK